MLSARERSLSREEKLLYDALLDTLNARLEPLKRCAAALGELDVLAAFSERAQELDWAQPELDEAVYPFVRDGNAQPLCITNLATKLTMLSRLLRKIAHCCKMNLFQLIQNIRLIVTVILSCLPMEIRHFSNNVTNGLVQKELRPSQ